jgi:hypothetical protein
MMTPEEPWLSYLDDPSSLHLDGSEVLMVARWSGGYCIAWNGPPVNGGYLVYVLEPPDTLWHLVGSRPFSDVPPEGDALILDCDQGSGRRAIGYRPPLRTVTPSGYTVDLDLCNARGDCWGWSYGVCPFGTTAWAGEVEVDGVRHPLAVPVPEAHPELIRGTSAVMPSCAACRRLDEHYAGVERPTELPGFRYDFGYFPVAVVQGDNAVHTGDNALTDLGMWPGDAFLGCGGGCSWPCSENLQAWAECPGPFAVLVGKWMAPFCEGWGLPRGIFRHIIQLDTGRVMLPGWSPFTEAFWNQPWEWNGIAATVQGYEVTVDSRTPPDCGPYLAGALRIRRPDGSEVRLDLPLRAGY